MSIKVDDVSKITKNVFGKYGYYVEENATRLAFFIL
jgi:hypothetical protein